LVAKGFEEVIKAVKDSRKIIKGPNKDYDGPAWKMHLNQSLIIQNSYKKQTVEELVMLVED
jgi:hypothetical protein